MKSKAAFYNCGILRSDLRRLWWAPALMTLYIALDQPLYLLNQLENLLESDLSYPIDLYHKTMLIYYCYPVVMAALLFRYLHTSKATQFFHTLPVTRGELLRTKLIVLWLFALIPTLINWAATAVIYLYYSPNGLFKPEPGKRLFWWNFMRSSSSLWNIPVCRYHYRQHSRHDRSSLRPSFAAYTDYKRSRIWFGSCFNRFRRVSRKFRKILL